MITATLYRTENKTLCGFSMTGHADAAGYGKDIVCAAASTLAINTANAIETLTKAGFSLEAEEDGGALELFLTSRDEKAELLLQALELGLKTMEAEYGKFITLKEEVRIC